MKISRRALLAGAALAPVPTLAVSKPRAASLMTPATARAGFATPGTSRVEPTFTEFLWYQDDKGRVWCHLECDTAKYTDPRTGISYGPGVFEKGSARGIFIVDFNPSLPATARQFWWPPSAVSQQPPVQHGQGMHGIVARPDGVAANPSTVGYTTLSPRTVGQALLFDLTGLGKETVTLAAQHFAVSGKLRFYVEFSYMVAE